MLSKYIEQFNNNDITFEWIGLFKQGHTVAQMGELVDCLLFHPNGVTRMWLGGNQLTDELGVKLARYLVVSSTIKYLNLSNSQLGDATYLALAAALRVNSSLRYLYLRKNHAVDRTRIDVTFIDAIRLNPVRSAKSKWNLYASSVLDTNFKYFENAAKKSTPPSMLEFILCVHLDTEKN